MARKPYFGLVGTKLNVAIGAIAGIDFLLFGYDQGVMGGLLTLPAFETTFPTINPYQYASGSAQANYTSTIQGITVASYNVGCFCGSIATIWIGDLLGRKWTIFVGSSIMIFGAILQCSSYSLPQFIIGRIITGFGNGLNTSTVPTWQSETSKSHRRGMLVMIEGALITCGVMISYWIDFAFSFIQGSSIVWRFPVAFQIFFAIIIVALVLKLPESPRWLILKGKDTEALDVLATLSDLTPDDQYVKDEFQAIRDTILEESQGKLSDLYSMDENRHLHRTILAYVNQMFQQITGINLITYYAATIYQKSIGLDGTTSRLLAAFNGTEYFLASWIAVFTIERFGRRPLMLFGATGQAICMAVLAISTSFPGNKSAGIAAATFLFLFNTFFAVGWLGMTWLYPAECVPLRIRARANALSTSANWAFNFMVVMVTPVAFSSIQYKTYIIFAAINAAIVPCVYFFYPETAYRSLEEMDIIFRKTTNIFDVVNVARDEPKRYGKKGELLVNYQDTEEYAANVRRRNSSMDSRHSRPPSHSSDKSGTNRNVHHLEKTEPNM